MYSGIILFSDEKNELYPLDLTFFLIYQEEKEKNVKYKNVVLFKLGNIQQITMMSC